MNTAAIHDPIRVLAAFAEGELKPVRFKWQERTYTVQRINGQWRDRRDECDAWHFSLQVDDTTYFVHFSSRDLQWWLDEVITL